MTKYELTQKIFLAEAAGEVAFAEGKKRIPWGDKNIEVFLKGVPVGGGACEIFDAWYKGWDTANLRKVKF